jgi:predicted acyl esterase
VAGTVRRTAKLAAFACSLGLVAAAPAAAQADPDPLAELKGGCADRVSTAPKPVPYEICTGTVESFDGTPLDATLTLPAKRGRRPLPLLVFLHGFLADKGEYLSETRGGTGPDRGGAAYKTVHWNNVWFASRGYAVLNYTARGQGSSGGQIGLASKHLEVEDTRHLTGLLVDDRDSADPLARIDRRKVGVLGSSYGGGQTWLLLTTRGAGAKRFGTWLSPAGRLLELGAAVPQYTWSDLLYSLVPNGHQSSTAPIDPATANTPLGIGKQTLIDGFLATAGSKFSPEIVSWLTRLNVGEPYDDPGDPVVPQAKRALTEDRSAFYQRDYFRALAAGRARRVPVFAAQGWTDPIFSALEALRMYGELRRADHGYPISLYLGDFEHLTAQVKVPDLRRFHDLATRMLDHALRGRGRRPRPHVEAAVTNCDPAAFGPVLRARSWAGLSEGSRVLSFPDPQTTSSPLSDPRGSGIDPVVVAQTSGRGCLTTELPPTSGVATYVAPVGEDDLTMAGLPQLRFTFETAANDLELNSRLWDVAPDGTQTLVDRGAYRSVGDAGGAAASYELAGNAWNFAAGHEIMLEITQDDSSFLRRDNFPSTATISDVSLSIPEAAHGP